MVPLSSREHLNITMINTVTIHDATKGKWQKVHLDYPDDTQEGKKCSAGLLSWRQFLYFPILWPFYPDSPPGLEVLFSVLQSHSKIDVLFKGRIIRNEETSIDEWILFFVTYLIMFCPWTVRFNETQKRKTFRRGNGSIIWCCCPNLGNSTIRMEISQR